MLIIDVFEPNLCHNAAVNMKMIQLINVKRKWVRKIWFGRLKKVDNGNAK